MQRYLAEHCTVCDQSQSEGTSSPQGTQQQRLEVAFTWIDALRELYRLGCFCVTSLAMELGTLKSHLMAESLPLQRQAKGLHAR